MSDATAPAAPTAPAVLPVPASPVPVAPVAAAPPAAAPVAVAPPGTPIIVNVAPAAPAPLPPPPPPIAPAAPVAPALDAEPSDDSKVPWLKGRLDRAAETSRKALLKEIGTESLDDIKAALDAKRQAEESRKTLEQKVTESAADVERYKAELAIYKAAVAHQATDTLAKLPADRRAAITSLAGDDPAKQIETYRVLYPTWAAADAQSAAQAAAQAQAAAAAAAAVVAAPAPAPAVAPPPPAAPAPVPPPAPVAAPPAVLPPAASTAPAPSAPAPAASNVANYFGTYEHLKSINPVKAAAYLARWGAQIEAERKSSTNQARG